MKNVLFSIKDVKVGFGAPFTEPNEAVAIRWTQDLVNRGDKNFIAEFYEDKELWRIGSMDDLTGALEPETPVLLARCVDLKKVVQ